MKAELLILGVLHREDMHPYEIKRRLQAAMVECYLDIEVGTLYYAVRQLAKEGHIAVRGQEQVVRGGERTIYTLTDSGRARFQTLLLERFADRSHSMHPLYPALLFMHLGDLDQIAALLRQRLAELEPRESEVGKLHAIIGGVVATGTRFLMEHGLAHLRIEIDWLQRLLAEIEGGRVHGPDFAAALALGITPPAGDDS